MTERTQHDPTHDPGAAPAAARSPADETSPIDGRALKAALAKGPGATASEAIDRATAAVGHDDGER